LPSFFELALLRERQPALDVLPGRTGVVTGRQQIDIHRSLYTPRTPELAVFQVRGTGHIVLIFQSPLPTLLSD
jgi:hypothetical protein